MSRQFWNWLAFLATICVISAVCVLYNRYIERQEEKFFRLRDQLARNSRRQRDEY